MGDRSRVVIALVAVAGGLALVLAPWGAASRRPVGEAAARPVPAPPAAADPSLPDRARRGEWICCVEGFRPDTAPPLGSESQRLLEELFGRDFDRDESPHVDDLRQTLAQLRAVAESLDD